MTEKIINKNELYPLVIGRAQNQLNITQHVICYHLLLVRYCAFFQAGGLAEKEILIFLFCFCAGLKGQLLDANLFKVVPDIEVPADCDDVISTIDCK